MDSDRAGVRCTLPEEMIERVLSLLPVPALCRMRSVCKAWKELIARPTFHDLCDLHGRNDVYFFMWSDVFRGSPPDRVVIDPIFIRTLSFLDVNARRWYSIPVPRVCGCGHETETRFMAMNDGFICELTTMRGSPSTDLALEISDPVAKTRRTLPAPPMVFSTDDCLPQIVTAVDGATRSYKVFLLNNLSQTHELKSQPRMYVHESFTNDWQELKALPNGVEGEWATSYVVFDHSLFVVKQHYDHLLSLFRYNLHDGTWAEVCQMSFTRRIDVVELVVSGNHMFLNVWLAFVSFRINPVPPDSHPELLFQTNQDYPGRLFEVYEVLIAENMRRKPVVQFTYEQLQDFFGSHGSEGDVTLGFPSVDCNGVCSSLVLVNAISGFQIRSYDLATGLVDVLPPHPLVPSPEEPIAEYYAVKNMKLSLRNLLAHSPKKLTSMEWKLLQ